MLCQRCGVMVMPQADGSCPSCGKRGHLSARLWQGRQINTLVPDETAPISQYACLYSRPFARRFRARARMRAVAKAMRPVGETAALGGGEDWISLLPGRKEDWIGLRPGALPE
jgi:hypothetical protein